MKKRRLDVDPRNITPLHRVKKRRKHHLRELVRRLRESGWQGRPLLVERIGRNRYQAWTGTHRLAAARRLRMRRVPVVVIDSQKWIRRWGPPDDRTIVVPVPGFPGELCLRPSDARKLVKRLRRELAACSEESGPLLLVDEVDDDFDKYVALLQAGDTLAARVMHQEVELNLGGDAQRCL